MPEENELRRAASQGARVRALSKRLEAKTTTGAKERKGSAVRKRSGSIPDVSKRTANAPGTPEGAGPNIHVSPGDGSPNPTSGSWTNVPSQGGNSAFTEPSVDAASDTNEHTPFDREIDGMTEEQLRERLKESHRELTRELKRSNKKDEASLISVRLFKPFLTEGSAKRYLVEVHTAHVCFFLSRLASRIPQQFMRASLSLGQLTVITQIFSNSDVSVSFSDWAARFKLRL